MPKNGTVHMERALFVLGDPNTGKSVQLRSMFRDWCLGRKGAIPATNNIPAHYALSHERWLYLRLTSPHETTGETVEKFLEKCEKKMRRNQAGARRWNFASPLQPTAAREMPDAVTTISKFIARFEPERVRVVVFHPDKNGELLADQDLLSLLTGLQALPRTEIIMTDARTRTGNGLVYSDFFDFT